MDKSKQKPADQQGHEELQRREAAKLRAIKRMVAEVVAKTGGPKARLDKDATAKPRTKLVGHFREGDCVGPGSVPENYDLRDVSDDEDGK